VDVAVVIGAIVALRTFEQSFRLDGALDCFC
jgi:hypothetical protein